MMETEHDAPADVQSNHNRTVKKVGAHGHYQYACAKKSKTPKAAQARKKQKLDRSKELCGLMPGQLVIVNCGDELKLAVFLSSFADDLNVKFGLFSQEVVTVSKKDVASAKYLDTDEHLTPGVRPVMILHDWSAMVLKYAIVQRVELQSQTGMSRVWVIQDDSGLEFSVPLFEVFQLPSFPFSTPDTYPSTESGSDDVRTALHLFQAMANRLRQENIAVADSYKTEYKHLEEKMKDDKAEHDLLMMQLKQQHLEDVTNLKEIGNMWFENWSKLGEVNRSLYDIIQKQKQIIDVKDTEIAKYKAEIQDLKRTLDVQQACAVETEKRLREQIVTLRHRVHTLESELERKGQALTKKSDEAAELSKKLSEAELEIKNMCRTAQTLQSRIEKYSAMDLISVSQKVGDSHFLGKSANGSKRASQYVKVPVPTVSSADATCNFRSLSERSRILKKILGLLSSSKSSCDSEGDMVATLTHFVRNNPHITMEACRNAKLVNVESLSAGDTVDLKVLLKLPMSRFRELRRFFHNHNINVLASEPLMRAEMRKRVDPDEIVEVGVASLLKNGVAEKPTMVAFCRVKSVKNALHHLCERHIRAGSPTIQFPLMFQNEVWLKIGGDKGGTSTKLVAELANLASANSAENTELLGFYEAFDSQENIWEIFSPLRDEVTELQGEEICFPEPDVDSILRVFLFGDYAWLCTVLGHQGPSSSYPCIYCLVPLTTLRESKGKSHSPYIFNREENAWVPNAECNFTARNFDMYKSDLAAFLNDARNPSNKRSNGKYHNSIVSDMLFPVPLEQVVPPPLHIFLGLVKSAYEMLETCCIKFDRAAMPNNVQESVRALYKTWDEASTLVSEVSAEVEELKKGLHEVERYLALLERYQSRRRTRENKECTSPICIETGTGSDDHNDPVKWVGCDSCGGWVHQLCAGVSMMTGVDFDTAEYSCFLCQGIVSKKDMVDHYSTQAASLSQNLSRVKDDLKKREGELANIFNEVKKHQGPLELKLTEVLEKDLLVVKQAYHSNSFIGNHCKKIIESPDRLVEVIRETSLDDYNKFTELFNRMASMNRLISATVFLSDEDIESLCQQCWSYGVWFPVNFPNHSITVKFHLLVYHIPEFVRRWRTVGIMGEHGSESIHRLINSDKRVYANIRDGEAQLKLIYQNHALRCTAKVEHLQAKARVCRREVEGKVCGGRLKMSVLVKEKKCQKCQKEFFLNSTGKK